MNIQKKKVTENQTFKSYVNFESGQESKVNTTTNTNDTGISTCRPSTSSSTDENDFSDDMYLGNLSVILPPNGKNREDIVDLQPKLLPGEAIVRQANNVLKFNNMSNHKTGISGALICTNFKLSFVTLEDYPSNLRLRNLLLQENDICLMNIESVYQVVNGRRKKVVSPVNISGAVEVVEIHCKDLRVYTFSFKFCSRSEPKDLLYAILHHHCPSLAQLLFAFDYCGVKEVKSVHPTSSKYTMIQDWEMELKRCGCSSWRVSLWNESFNVCDSLPEAFVVPPEIFGKDVSKLSPLYNGQRFPIWSWGMPHGNVLIRSSAVYDPQNLSRKLTEAIKKAIPQHGGLHFLNLDNVCPSVRDIQSSYSKLQEICKPENVHSYWKLESTYLSSIESTHWFHHLSACLNISLKIAECMSIRKDSVVITELGGRDLSCVISSLVQILLDPFCRTQHGFECLVQKEWVALGHPFQERLGQIKVEEVHQSPVFLLFLDCMWQILQQFPSKFEFTETYLTNLWDTVHISCFGTFLFNCHRERINVCSKQYDSRRLHSSWDWSLQFTKQDMILFKNPLYILSAQENENHPRPWSLACDGPWNSRNRPFTPAKKMEEKENTLLELDPSVTRMQLWTQCYLRWVPMAQVVGGGLPVVYLQNAVIWDEICTLEKLLLSLPEPANLRYRRVASDNNLFRSEGDNSCGVKHDSHIVTSAFPYSPIGPFDCQHFHRVPSSSCLLVDVVGTDQELDE
ncbi:myotubularin-related protein 10-A-like [Limulus polyphemus]|uniref:Myotubularin-related protein 10-A-like n=1 Tax=Limulus polyphemus TaxID=6850 RepID=A0ABM1BF06_LIMPO|nr:myotubularin-related protein 10-A-like [Limulus polyphemus]